jgi:hypothetical protein
MYIGWWFPVQHIFYLARVHCYSTIRDNMTQKGNFSQPELTLTPLGIQLVLPKLLQDQPQMFGMFLFILREYEYVINEHHHKLVKILHKHFIHQIHEVGRCIGQTK